jgi:hypothetical protein
MDFMCYVSSRTKFRGGYEAKDEEERDRETAARGVFGTTDAATTGTTSGTGRCQVLVSVTR